MIKMPEIIDISDLSSVLAHLSNLIGLSLSLYGHKGDVLLSPMKEDKFLAAFKSSQKGEDEYNDFFKSCIEKAIHKEDVLILKGPAEEYHFFIPFSMNNAIFIITGSGIYISLEEFEDFYLRVYKI